MGEKSAQKQRRQEKKNRMEAISNGGLCTVQQEKQKKLRIEFCGDIGSRAHLLCYMQQNSLTVNHFRFSIELSGVVIVASYRLCCFFTPLWHACVCVSCYVSYPMPQQSAIMCISCIVNIKLNDWESSIIFFLTFYRWTQPSKMISINLSFDCTFL